MDDFEAHRSVGSVWNNSQVNASLESDTNDADAGIATFLWHLFKKNQHTDVEFSVNDKENGSVITFSSHKMVLSLWSPYFADMFYGPDRDVHNIITVKDVDVKAFEEMLKYMYGCIPSMKTCREAFEIYKVSSKFQVGSLIQRSCKAMTNNKLTVFNVFDVWEASDYIGDSAMKQRCLEFIQKETFQVLKANDVSKVAPSMINLLLDSQTLSLSSEYDLLQWIYAWAKNMYIKVPCYSSTREVLEEYLPKMHFTSLSSREFAEFYKDHETFCEKDDAFSILMNIAMPQSWPLPEWQNSKAKFREYTGVKSENRK